MQKELPSELKPQPESMPELESDEISCLVDELEVIDYDEEVKKNAKEFDLCIQRISWSDNARNKHSCFGPNICDMSLLVNDTVNHAVACMPMIRFPNFSDITADIPIETFNCKIGNESDNESGNELKTIPLRDYLTDLGLFLERDSHILTSCQFCIIPEGCDFIPDIKSYQSTSSDPSVLVVIVSAYGTSSQTINRTMQHILFNKNGNGHYFKAKRLSDDRCEKKMRQEELSPSSSSSSLTNGMTKEENEKNQLLIFQIPLKQKRIYRSEKYEEGSLNDTLGCGVSKEMYVKRSLKTKRGIESAILGIGSFCQPYPKLDKSNLVRDERYPIRCTRQFYQITDTKDIKKETFEMMSKRILESYEYSSSSSSPSANKTSSTTSTSASTTIGSLVTEENTNRVTEPQLT